MVRSTLDPVPRRTVLQKWDSVSTHPMGRSTHSGNFKAQRKGAKEIHKYFMAKKNLNESIKSTIQKVVALTAHSKSSEHSASSLENESSNGSTRSDREKENCYYQEDSSTSSICPKSSKVYTNLSQVVSTQSTCVLTQSASRVDTLNGQVDTSPRFQKTQLPDWDSASTHSMSANWDSVSTHSMVRSTLDPVPKRTVLQKWDSVSTHPMGRSTHSGNFVT
ncbi:hypothetical protein Taro_054353 [Colocasia esculenta]|uniref:Uncharacterized protein n=1 Tax=Colocasia esculenta TaxID=4460 RepID=A0A843XQU5_COLES|nr:hypothetical protein [Colocasia esculenta]